jgi:hypothetical protein
MHRREPEHIIGLAGEMPGRRQGDAARPAVPGRAPELYGQRHRLYTLIVGAGLRHSTFPFASWTREVVLELIRREFAMVLSVVSAGRLLHKRGPVRAASAVPGPSSRTPPRSRHGNQDLRRHPAEADRVGR